MVQNFICIEVFSRIRKCAKAVDVRRARLAAGPLKTGFAAAAVSRHQSANASRRRPISLYNGWW